MAQEYLAKTSKILQRSFCSRFYEKLSAFCYNGLRKKYLSASRKAAFLFLLLLCTEINFSLDAPVSRSLRVNVPYASALNFAEYNPKTFLFPSGYIHKAHNYFLETLRYSLFVAEAHSCGSFTPASIKAAVCNFLVSFTQLLIYDDRIIGDREIKISPIQAQGPPFIECLFPACFSVLLPQYVYSCANFIFIQKENYLSCVFILPVLALLGSQFFNQKIKERKNQKAEKDSAFMFLRLPICGISKEEVRKHFF